MNVDEKHASLRSIFWSNYQLVKNASEVCQDYSPKYRSDVRLIPELLNLLEDE